MFIPQNKRTYFWYWCGCEIEIRGYRPTFCQPYLSSPNPSNENFTAALTDAVNVLKNDTADIAGMNHSFIESNYVWLYRPIPHFIYSVFPIIIPWSCPSVRTREAGNQVGKFCWAEPAHLSSICGETRGWRSELDF